MEYKSTMDSFLALMEAVSPSVDEEERRSHLGNKADSRNKGSKNAYSFAPKKKV
jgi:hypothetical protein